MVVFSQNVEKYYKKGEKQVITPIIKTQGMDCNIKCEYCYYDCPERQNENLVVNTSDIQRLLLFLAKKTVKKRVTIIWHGGEPLLVGIPYFKEVCKYEREITNSTGVQFRNRIQTNGTLIDESWIKFFLEERFRVGISIDGPREIHDRYRVNKSGSGTFDLAMRGVHLCQDFNLKIGCLSVVTKASLGKAENILNFFVTNNIFGFRVKQCYELDKETGATTDFSITPEEYGEFLINLFNAWITLNNPKVRCGPLDDFLRGFFGKPRRQCFFKRECHKYWGVWPDGSIYQCEFFGDPRTYFGNYNQDSFDKILERQQNSLLNKNIRELRPDCRECRWKNFCNGGCARYDIGLNRENNLFCTSNKMVLEHIARYLGA